VEAVTGPIDRDIHKYDTDHRLYNIEISKLIQEYLSRNKITSDQLDTVDANRILDLIHSSRNPAIMGYNRHMIFRSILRKIHFRYGTRR
jgi:hypothetical protein